MRALRWAAWAVAGLALAIGAAWLAVPWVVQSQLQTRGSEWLGRELRVQRVEFAPWALALTLHGLSLAGREGASAPPQFEAARVHVDAEWRSLLRLAPVIEGIEVDAPKLRATRTGSAEWDFDDIVERLGRSTDPAPAPSEPTRFALFNLRLRDGEAQVVDRPADRVHTLAGVQVTLPFLSNLPDDVRVTVEPHLAFSIDGRQVDLRGRALPFSNDRATALSLKVERLDLAKWWAYLPGSIPLRPIGGSFDADLELQFAQPPGKTPRLALSGKTSLQGMALRNRAGAAMAGWKSLSAELADVRPLERVISLGAVVLDGADVDVRRNASGVLEWARLGPESRAPAASASAATAAAPTGDAASWQVHVDRVEVRGARVRWHDDTVRPALALTVEELQASSERLRWPAVGRVPVRASARVSQDGKTVAQWKVAGETSDRDAALTFEIDDVQLGAAGPYLRAVLQPALDGRARLAGSLDWSGGEAPRGALQIDSLQVDALRVTERGARDPALRVAGATLTNARIDWLAQRATLGALAIKAPSLRLRRAASGLLNVQSWAVEPDARPAASPARPKSSPWRAGLSRFQLDGGKLAFIDEAARTGAPVAMDVAGLRVNLRDAVWPATGKAARLELEAQLRVPAAPGATPDPPGRVKARGSLTLAPVGWRGQLDVERWPLAAFEPYFGHALPVQLQRAEVGVRGDVDLKWPAQGLRLDAKADVLVADVQLSSRPSATAAGEELMSWQSLTLKPVRVAVAPDAKPRVEIDEVVWSDFYSRLVISEDGRFNLREVGAAGDGGAAPAAGAASATVAAASASASAPAAPKELPVDLVVGATKLVNGRVDFTDHFVRPNYSAALSELNGTLGRIDSGSRDMAAIELRGRAAGTALLEIRGALNPIADPLALDITARATDLELAPLSPYAGKYAGYAIERGKLSVDVAYRIDPDGKLVAKNQVILNQLTFGEKIDSPDATKLPVRLAVALLTDRNGVIDINLPISGSINDPQFSVWGIVWRLVGNLLLKAFTSPFALLAGGGSQDLSVVQFVPGTATFAPGSGEVVDRVAKALSDRPALRMTVSGTADPVRERDAIRTAALEARITAEQRRELARAGAAAAASAPPPALTAQQRTRIVKQIYTDTALPDKPRNVIGMAKDLPLADMEARLKAATAVTEDSARELAIQRGLAVRDALIAKGLPSERLFLGAPKVHAPGDDDASWSPRVQLLLNGP